MKKKRRKRDEEEEKKDDETDSESEESSEDEDEKDEEELWIESIVLRLCVIHGLLQTLHGPFLRSCAGKLLNFFES